MQRCPKCYRTYQNDNQKYCTACGGRLVPDEEIPTSYGLDDTAATYTSTTPARIESAPATGFDPNLTVRVPAPPPPPVFDPNKTVANVPPPRRQAPETVAVNLAESNLPPPPEAPETEETDSRIAATVSLTAPPPVIEPPPVVEEVAVIVPEIVPEPEDVPVAANVETPEIAPAAPPLPVSSPFADTLHGAEEEADSEEVVTPEPPPPMPTVALDSVPLPVAAVEPEILPEPVSLPPTPVAVITEPPPVIAPEPPPLIAPEPPPAPANVKAAAAAGKNHLPLILGILFALGLVVVAGAAGAYFLVIKPRLEANKRLAQPTPKPTPEPTPDAQPTPATDNPGGANPTASPKSGGSLPDFAAPPPNTVEFINKQEKLRGALAQHFVDFTFYYPKAWKLAAPNAAFFAEVSNSGADGVPREDFALGWYESSGTFALDEAGFAARVEKKSAEIAKKLPGYQKLAEGPTKMNGTDAYQFSYQGQATDSAGAPLTFWGRVVFLPPNVENQKNGVIMYLTATSKSPDIKNIDDVGEKGEMPIILNNFRLGKRQ